MEKISSGNIEFDKWLNGGYDKDIITTIYGPAGSGKTNLCLIAAAKIAEQGKKVIFIDTEGGFSAARLTQITNENVASNILIYKVTDFKEQREAFNKLINNTKDIGLIVVDSIAMQYRLELGNANTEKDIEKVTMINSALARQIKIVNKIARKKQIPVLVTNQVYTNFDERDNIKMVGGDMLKYGSKCLIELQRENFGRKKAILRKHRSMPEKEFSFTINDKGINKTKFKIF